MNSTFFISNKLKAGTNIFRLYNSKYQNIHSIRELNSYSLFRSNSIISNISQYRTLGTDIEEAPKEISKFHPKSIIKSTKTWGLRMRFCFRVYICDLSKVYQILHKRYILKEQYTALQQRELMDGALNMIKIIPFILICIIPGLELAVPFIIMKVPNLLPSSLQEAFHSNLQCYPKLLQNTIFFWDSMLSETILSTTDSSSYFYLSRKKMNHIMLQLHKKLTMKDFATIVSKFNSEFFFKYASLRAIQFLCREMDINTRKSRDYLIIDIMLKAQKIKSQDYVLSLNIDSLNTMSINQLHKLSCARGINCYGIGRQRIIKRLTRWVHYSITLQSDIIFMFLTRFPHYDTMDLLSETVANPTCDIINGVKMLFDTDPKLKLDYTYQYSVNIMKSLLSHYHTGFNI